MPKRPRQRTIVMQARDPATSPSILRRLAVKAGRPDVREAVAANPSTPLDVVLALAGEHPRAAAQNPALAKVARTSPLFLRSATPRALDRMIFAAPSDQALIRALHGAAPHSLLDDEYGCECEGPTCAESLLRNQATPGDVLERLAGLEVGGGGHLPERDRDALARLLRGALRRLALHPNATARILGVLMCGDDPEARRLSAANPAAPRDLLDALNRCGVPADMRAPAALTGTLDERMFRVLAEAGPFTWDLATRHPRVDPEVLGRLVSSPSLAVRSAAIANPGVPAAALQAVFPDAWKLWPGARPRPVRELLQGSPERARYGYNHEDPHPLELLKRALARQPATPEDLLRMLAAERARAVWSEVARRPALPPLVRLQLVHTYPRGCTPPALEDPDCPSEVLELIGVNHVRGVDYLDLDTARALARHPKAPPVVLGMLAGFDDEKVRAIVAERQASAPQAPGKRWSRLLASRSR